MINYPVTNSQDFNACVEKGLCPWCGAVVLWSVATGGPKKFCQKSHKDRFSSYKKRAAYRQRRMGLELSFQPTDVTLVKRGRPPKLPDYDDSLGTDIWTLKQDALVYEPARFPRGATFSDLELKEMMKFGSITAGSILSKLNYDWMVTPKGLVPFEAEMEF